MSEWIRPGITPQRPIKRAPGTGGLFLDTYTFFLLKTKTIYMLCNLVVVKGSEYLLIIFLLA